ncbi:hypothetical protein [Chryseobacterium sp. JK1]|uniref:hypothetical protein n=1 Tax=Chryseobacterium sp. JK1 TaxID=874294 RepID=UPI003D693077
MAVDTNLKNLLEKLYKRDVSNAEYMKAYRSKDSKFELTINDEVYTINKFEN